MSLCSCRHVASVNKALKECPYFTGWDTLCSYLFGYSLTVVAYNHKSIHNVVGNIVTKAKVHLRFVLCFNEDLLP